MTKFFDRAAAGRSLGSLLSPYRGRDDVLVLGLPRGGVPVAFEISAILQAPLDVMVVRKLGAPGQPELALGALASGGVVVMNESVLGWFDDSAAVRAVVAHERTELARREALYRNERLPLDVRGRTVILVDDGAATGASMRAAILATRKLGASHVVAAVPVASADALAMMRAEADAVACLLAPSLFRSVGEWYERFDQTSDAEVATLLARARRGESHVAASPRTTSEPRTGGNKQSANARGVEP